VVVDLARCRIEDGGSRLWSRGKMTKCDKGRENDMLVLCSISIIAIGIGLLNMETLYVLKVREVPGIRNPYPAEN
jgi:hypothetical protein